MILKEHDGLTPVIFGCGGKKYVGLALGSFGMPKKDGPWAVQEVYEISSMNLMVPNPFNPKTPQMITQLHVNPPDFSGVLKTPLKVLYVSTVEWWYTPDEKILELVRGEAIRSIDVKTPED